MSNVVQSDLEARVWKWVDEGIQRSLFARGLSEEAVDWITADLCRRCREMPIEFSLMVPERISAPADLEMHELRELVAQQTLEFVHEMTGFFVRQMLELEVELCATKSTHDAREALEN